MLWDLGLRPNEDLEDIEKVKEKILTLDKEFDLVMIAEKERHAELISIQCLKIGTKNLFINTWCDDDFDEVFTFSYFLQMDESLVLLADLLCWSLDDVAYVSQNKRSNPKIDRNKFDRCLKIKTFFLQKVWVEEQNDWKD